MLENTDCNTHFHCQTAAGNFKAGHHVYILKYLHWLYKKTGRKDDVNYSLEKVRKEKGK